MTQKGRRKFDKGQNYTTAPGNYFDQMADYIKSRGHLHHSHRTYLTSLLTSRGIPVPEGEREMLDAARKL